MQSWGPWLTRLTKMLNPDGLLLFSTLPLDTLGRELDDADKEGFKRASSSRSTTRHAVVCGAQYGTASVSEKFRRAVWRTPTGYSG